MNENEKIYKEALAYWGQRKQMRMVQEECAELILAVSHFLRQADREKKWDKDSEITMNAVIEETADVLNMVEQLRYMVGPKQVDKIREIKLARTKAKLKKYKGE